MGDTDSRACQTCRDAIGNFVCPDCLAERVRDWLPSRLAPKFSRFHNVLLFYFDAYTSEPVRCGSCRDAATTLLCSGCYLEHVSAWMRSVDRPLAARFSREFAFGKDDTCPRCGATAGGHHQRCDYINPAGKDVQVLP
ncbi:MAG: hypothetical protein HY369_00245 [Candidatus Aenigmarchaeota archaeon]|nr:hypothetical protein [Candidatus Aenigmarchaeota archaeon]